MTPTPQQCLCSSSDTAAHPELLDAPFSGGIKGADPAERGSVAVAGLCGVSWPSHTLTDPMALLPAQKVVLRSPAQHAANTPQTAASCPKAPAL